MDALLQEIRACDICAGRFAATATGHAPAPVAWFRPSARVLIASQAPGLRAHRSGRPFTDPSGVRLRAWLGLTEAEFYDLSRVAIVPASFCFPGYGPRGGDLPPPPVCAATWRARVMATLGAVRLRVLVGGAAFRLHLAAAPGGAAPAPGVGAACTGAEAPGAAHSGAEQAGTAHSGAAHSGAAHSGTAQTGEGPAAAAQAGAGRPAAAHPAAAGGVTATVQAWRAQPADVVVLPHPSWRNNAWLARNPWFAEDLLPEARARVRAALADA